MITRYHQTTKIYIVAKKVYVSVWVCVFACDYAFVYICIYVSIIIIMIKYHQLTLQASKYIDLSSKAKNKQTKKFSQSGAKEHDQFCQSKNHLLKSANQSLWSSAHESYHIIYYKALVS